jgi:hypothetical protein
MDSVKTEASPAKMAAVPFAVVNVDVDDHGAFDQALCCSLRIEGVVVIYFQIDTGAPVTVLRVLTGGALTCAGIIHGVAGVSA